MLKQIERTKPSLFGLFTNPIREFRLIREQPRFFLSLLLLSFIVSITFYYVGETIGSNPEAIANIERLQGQAFSPAIKDQINVFVGISYGFAGFMLPWVTCLLNSLVLFLLVKAYQGKATFKQLYAFSAHLYLLTTLSLITDFLVNRLAGHPLGAPVTSLGIFIPDLSGGLLSSLLSYLSLFTIWYAIWLISGLQEITGLSKKHSQIVTILFLVIGFFGLTNVTIFYHDIATMLLR
ncbi:YIP1 family protein [Thermoactinomyces sp. DSM 45892]|uniref:YIP1 family protein n=1 Tax=Thermoactinomyces sp. DSM 45892 TaxID=1882753 RepID=UPI0008999E5B|nr:YIP1 family protein [Thermoactinomyces sp. DSM 45892]SDZ34072.1 Yip1 domain-containing protein [Thermoactinomyces sp. DSM 45892]